MSVLVMAACVLLFSVLLGTNGSRPWALPAFLAAIAFIATLGGVLLWRARGR